MNISDYKWYAITFILLLFLVPTIAIPFCTGECQGAYTRALGMWLIFFVNLLPLFVLTALVRKGHKGMRTYAIAMLWSMVAALVIGIVGFALSDLVSIWVFLGFLPFVTIFWVIIGLITAKISA
jgi:hypothetical protein